MPGADLSVLRARAELLSFLRTFLIQRGLLEVETPLLWPAAIPEAHIELFEVAWRGGSAFLMPSPELFLKQLLALGAGDLFQLGKAFRRGEVGRWHNPEFTLLEWYRVGWSLEQLIGEVVALVRAVLGPLPLATFDYGELFEAKIGLSWKAPREKLFERAKELGLPEAERLCASRADWLDLLFAARIQPSLPDGIVVVQNYPEPLAALARLRDQETAARFELFVDRIELANGYHELNDPKALRARLEAARRVKLAQGEVAPPIDETFLELSGRLPDCCGVALGVDRLLALRLKRDSLRELLPFPWPA